MIPAIVNRHGGTAGRLLDALGARRAFDVRSVEPDELAAAVRHAVRTRPARIAVGGGDGTIGTAAGIVAATETALAILPGGTLNHFARDHGIPVEPRAAVRVAMEGRVTQATVAYAAGRLFLNTSAVGSYVSYVRLRNRLQRYVGYRLASLGAALRLLVRLRPVSVQLEVDGVVRRYETPLVFVGVGEREFKVPVLGGRLAGGRNALHVIVVRQRRTVRLMGVGFAAAAVGIETIAHANAVDSYLVDRCLIDLGRHQHHLALDGEIVTLGREIEYRIARDAVRIVVPDGDEDRSAAR